MFWSVEFHHRGVSVLDGAMALCSLCLLDVILVRGDSDRSQNADDRYDNDNRASAPGPRAGHK